MKTKTKEPKVAMPVGFYFDDKNHKYYFDGKPMTGVTTILGVLAKPQLIPWAARMACEHIMENIAELITEDRVGRLLILKEAENAHRTISKDAATKGTDTHALIEDYINQCIELSHGYPMPILEGIDGNIRPFSVWAAREGIRFIAAEQKLYSKKLFIAGTADFVFEKDGKAWVGDIKTYKKLWDRVPMLQCAGYALLWEEMRSDITPSPTISGYVVFNLPKERDFDESQDVRWSYAVDEDTKAFLACVTLYRTLANWN